MDGKHKCRSMNLHFIDDGRKASGSGSKALAFVDGVANGKCAFSIVGNAPFNDAIVFSGRSEVTQWTTHKGA